MSQNTPDSFYPYREQGNDVPVPIIDSEDDIHKLHSKPTPPQNKIPTPLIIGFSILAILAVGIFSYNQNARARIAEELALTPTATPIPTATQTPTPLPTPKTSQFSNPLLQEAYYNTIQAASFRAGFISDVTTHINNKETQTSQDITSRVEGYFLGTTDSTTIQTELRITETDYPNAKPAFFGQILVNGRLFMKRNDDQWIERNTSDFNKLYENQPIDVTAYAYNMVDTLYTENKALLRAIDTSSIKDEPDEKIDDKDMKVFSYHFSPGDFIGALESDAATKQFTIDDAKKVLANVTMDGKLYVDPETKTIVRIQNSGTNFTQITEQEAEQEQLGITTTHDISFITNLLDYNQAVGIAPPTQ